MNNELMILDNKNDTTEATVFTTCKPQTHAEKVQLFNNINNPDERIRKMINKPILLKDIYCEKVVFKDAETGEESEGIRTVIIDDNGESYACASKGVFNSLKKIFAIFGSPETWEEPITVIPVLVESGKNQVITLEIGYEQPAAK